MKRKDILISANKFETDVAVLENGKVVEFYRERANYRSLIGRIYKGKIENVIPGISGAFVSLGLPKNGFLPLEDIPSETLPILSELDVVKKTRKDKRLDLKKGQEILVQIVKEPIGQKGPRLSSYISLPGKYLVLVPGFNRIGISKKIINKKERHRLRKIASSLKLKNAGLIVRTDAEGINEKNIKADFEYLLNLWENIERKAVSEKAPVLIHEEPPLSLRVVRDLYDSTVNNLIVDSRQEYENILAYLREFAPHLRSRVKLHEGENSLFKVYNVEEAIQSLFKSKVWLPSGGFITIDHTEALVAIDVNTGKFSKEEDQERLIFKTNMEAAYEIANQIRLRDLSGLIVIDFIDMKNKDNMQKVLREFKNYFKGDKVEVDFGNLSRFGLLEMARERRKKELTTQFTEKCHICHGQGKIPSKEYMLSEIEKFFERNKDKLKGEELLIKTYPDFATYLSTQKLDEIAQWIKEYEVSISIKEDVYKNPGEIYIIKTSTDEILYKKIL